MTALVLYSRLLGRMGSINFKSPDGGSAAPERLYTFIREASSTVVGRLQALARGQAVRRQVAGGRTAVAAAQAKAVAGGSFLGTVVEGTPCLPGPTADLLQIAY